mmetsp:Transcript_31855/g.102883  ORF Transcript_31855/g.102883 Transcript_31855/m.102883 type:complete len:490 (-) Transcript_31855:252-1721(-)
MRDDALEPLQHPLVDQSLEGGLPLHPLAQLVLRRALPHATLQHVAVELPELLLGTDPSVGHKVEERPQLLVVVGHGSAGQAEAAWAGDGGGGDRDAGLRVLDLVRLVPYRQLPRVRADLVALQAARANRFVRGQHQLNLPRTHGGEGGLPLGPVPGGHTEAAPRAQLAQPVAQRGDGHHDHGLLGVVGREGEAAADVRRTGCLVEQGRQERDGLHSFAQAHLVAQDAALARLVLPPKEADAVALIGPEVPVDRGGHLGRLTVDRLGRRAKIRLRGRLHWRRPRSKNKRTGLRVTRVTSECRPAVNPVRILLRSHSFMPGLGPVDLLLPKLLNLVLPLGITGRCAARRPGPPLAAGAISISGDVAVRVASGRRELGPPGARPGAWRRAGPACCALAFGRRGAARQSGSALLPRPLQRAVVAVAVHKSPCVSVDQARQIPGVSVHIAAPGERSVVGDWASASHSAPAFRPRLTRLISARIGIDWPRRSRLS